MRLWAIPLLAVSDPPPDCMALAMAGFSIRSLTWKAARNGAGEEDEHDSPQHREDGHLSIYSLCYATCSEEFLAIEHDKKAKFEENG